MEEFNALVNIIERLLGPNGCPWDQEQTLVSMRHSVLEETAEVIEAINLNDNAKIEEELGDLFFNVIFLCKLAEKENRFTMTEALRTIAAKLIRRHPHVFGDAKVKDAEEVLKQWNAIKQKEKIEKTNLFKEVPQELPALARAQKIGKKLAKAGHSLPKEDKKNFENELEFGALLFEQVQKGHGQGLDAEQSLRNYLAHLEKNFESKKH